MRLGGSAALRLVDRFVFAKAGSVREDLVAGANSVFDDVEAVAGEEKSMLNGAFTTLGAFAVAAAAGSSDQLKT